MTVEAICLNNFMAFEDTGWIELRPICLLFGRNSTGKSAIIRAIRLLRQSLNDFQEDRHLSFIAENELNLGSFTAAIHGQDSQRIMTFRFRCKLPPGDKLETLRDNINIWRRHEFRPFTYEEAQDWLDFSLGFSSKDGGLQVELVKISIECPWARDEFQKVLVVLDAEKIDGTYITNQIEEMDEARSVTEMFNTWQDDIGDWWVSSDFLLASALEDQITFENTEAFWSTVSIAVEDDFLPTLIQTGEDLDDVAYATDFLFVKSIVEELGKIIRNFLNNIEYIGPIRPEPQWVYVLDELTISRWKKHGLDNYINFLLDKVDDAKLRAIDGWLKHLSLGHRIGEHKIEYAHEVPVAKIEIFETEDSKESVNLSNVGYGTSQVLPVLVQSVMTGMTSEEQLVIVEQPELHLHPRAQANLADLFVDMIYRQIKPLPTYSNTRFLIETHSEDLLLRLQRRLAETSAEQADEQKKN